MPAPRLPFDAWLRAVDAECIRRCGIGYEDLPDWRYADAYADGYSPARAARAAIRAAKSDYL